MKLRIGDKVRLLNETGEGVVSRIKDKNTVFVEMEDGFEIPFAASQLVPIHTELILDKSAENINMDPGANLSDAIYFVIEPDHELPSLMNDYRIYLFNASSFHLIFTYSIKDGEHYQTIKHGEAGVYQKVLLKTIKPNFFNEYNYHKLDCLFFKNTYYKSQLPISEVVNVTPQTLARTNTIKHDEFKWPVYIFLLKDDFNSIHKVEDAIDPSRLAKLKSNGLNEPVTKLSKSSKAYLLNLEKEVDLHIEELIDSVQGLSKSDMLQLQLKKFEKEMDAAFEKRMKKIIFIHGVGNGRLKSEILSKLKNMEGVKFHDAQYKEYGYGATEVIIL